MPSERGHAEDGNTLVLMPVAVLVLLVLAAITFDAAVVHLHQRRLADLAASLANDAATALDLDSVYDLDAQPSADPARVADLAAARLAAFAHDDTLQEVVCTPQIGAQVTVTCQGRVVAIFGRALAPEDGLFGVRATETARADRG